LDRIATERRPFELDLEHVTKAETFDVAVAAEARNIVGSRIGE